MESKQIKHYKNWNVNELVHFMLHFTRTYQKHEQCPANEREIACLQAQYPRILLPVEEGDLFAGRLIWPAICFTPQSDGNEGGFGYVFSFSKLEELYHDPDLAFENKLIINELKDYWKDKHSAFKTREAYPSGMASTLPSDNWTAEPGVAFPLYRMAGTHLDFDLLLQNGIPGLLAKTRQAMAICDDREKHGFYKGLESILEIFIYCLEHYAGQVKRLLESEINGQRKQELQEMERVLRNLINSKPASFREAIQLMFLYALVSGTANYGRLDEYLGDFYAKDLENGIVDQVEGLRLMKGLWKMMIAREAIYDGRVVVGGKGRRNEANANKVAELAILTAGELKDVLPQLTLRFHQQQQPGLYNLALDVIGQGSTFPMLYNDDVNIPAVAKAFDIDEQAASHYLPFGCGEYIIYHQSTGTPSSVLNMLKALELVLHDGVDLVSGHQISWPGKDTGNIQSFEKLWMEYTKIIEHHVKILTLQEKIEYDTAGREAGFFFLSLLYDDCLTKGKSIFNGGVRHLGGTEEIYGFSNVVDSLYAIKQVVFDKAVFDFNKLREMLVANFKGFDMERQQLLDCAKYGNDQDDVDDLATKVHDQFAILPGNKPV